MLKKIFLKNFKGIGDPGVEVELKPITLLFGPNSGGKSTILHSLLYAKEIFERRNYNPVSSYFGGSNSDLGGYYNFIHNHDLSKQISLGFELDIERESFQIEPGSITGSVKRYLPLEDDFDYKDFEEYEEPIQQIVMNALSANLQLNIQWNQQYNLPVGLSYALYIDNELFLSIEISRMTESFIYYKLSSINYQHKSLLNVFQLDDLISFEGILEKYSEQAELELQSYSEPFPLVDEKFVFSDSLKDYLLSLDDDGKECHRFLVIIGEVFKSLHFTLLDDLKKFRYIGPIRKIPERNFIPHRSDEKNRWADGSAAWDSLFNGSVLPVTVNKWMTLLKLNYLLKISEDKDLPVDISNKMKELIAKEENILEEQLQHYYDLISDTTEVAQKSFIEFFKKLPFSRIKNEINKMVEYLPGKEKIFLVDQNTNIHLQPFDIGVGLSQVIPVIIGVLERSYSIFSVEQPELHIHPASQVELADLFIDQVNRSADSIYLVETHSEHIILRMLRRIESSTKKIQSLNEKDIRKDKKKIQELFKSTDDTFLYLDQKMINVFWCEQSEIGQKMELMPIDETGEFTRQWPKGFFEERSKELFPDD